jgi:prepilin-type N-terminal cleavage/methylation domain-containing protein
MNRGTDTTRRSGFTLLEMAMAIVLLALVIGNVYTILGGTSRDLANRNVRFEADTQARRALERIAMAVVGSHESSLYAQPTSPDSEDFLDYEEFLGLQDTNGDGIDEPVMSPRMRIALSGESGGQVSWYENPGEVGQKHVVWVKDVPQFAVGEIPANGVDDNDNGLLDESGLAFVKEGRSVRIVLSLRVPDGQGGFLDRQVETTVTCRN